MQQLRTTLLRLLLATLLATALTSCGTSTENGVTIEQGGNPLKFW